MSVSLIVFRLELADDSPSIQFKYTAPGFEHPCVEKLTYAQALEKSHSRSPKTDQQRYKGRREYLPITIETFFTEEVQMDDTEDGSLSPLPGALSPRSGSEESQVSETSPMTPGTDHSGRSQASSSSGSPQLQPSAKVKRRVRERGGAKSRDKPLSVVLPSESSEGEGGAASNRPSSGKKTKAQSTNTIWFFSGNPLVEKTEGIIHLYKHNQLTSLTEDISRSEMICILSVPATMTSQDLLLYVAPVEPWVENIKIIRDSTPNQYMVLLKFKSQKYADDFYKNFNNIAYNSIESDICHLAYVAEIETVKCSGGGGMPVSGLTELPVCPVCLERMDESVDGILTILCNHSFHGSCLVQWGDTTCPVCRYVQTPEPVPDNKCFHCDANKNLWICLICGHVGCGRYEGGHAFTHFQETDHTYSMQLESNRVWDYAGDNYVHRLVQSKGDGKMVEVDEGERLVEDDKLDSVTLEYTYLLTSQLEAQRHHFQEKIERIEKDALKRVSEMEAQSKKAIEHCDSFERKLASANKEKQLIERKSSVLSTKLQKLVTDLEEEKEMNKCLRENQSQWQSRVCDMEKQLLSRDQELADMKEQLRDLMFYLDAQQKLANTTGVSQEEIQEGQIVVQTADSGGATGKLGRKKGGR